MYAELALCCRSAQCTRGKLFGCVQEKEKEAAVPKMRIVSYFGDWICECGRQNRLWDTCKCQKAGPCRDWVRGRCKYNDECR